MPSRSFKYLLLCAPVLLAACEGEATRIEGIVPYVMERTAGTGVAYVRAKMMPEKALVIETKTEVPAKAEPPPEIKSAEPVFEKEQKK